MTKLNRNWKKRAAALALVGVVAIGGMAAGAAAARQYITAELRPDIALQLNGKNQTLSDSMIAYNGRTYLPIRNVGDLLGLEVDWNNDTNTVILNDNGGTSTGTGTNTGTSTGSITLERAKEIALADAGLTASQVTFTQARQDWDDGRQTYEVDFYTSSSKYDYEILTADGTILQRERETFSSGNSGTGDIGLEQVKTIALTDAGLTASQVTFTQTRQDWDDGRLTYEVDFYTSTHKYDYEILASNGTILQEDRTALNVSGTGSSGTGTGTGTASAVTLEQAKTIALSNAGLSASQVTFVKAHQDWDDGRLEYEIEFYYGNVEYEYTIDANTGKIVDMDRDSRW